MVDELPETLSPAGFQFGAGIVEGLTPGVLRGNTFAKPYRGSRTVDEPTTLLERAAAFAPLLRPWQCLGGVSALAVLGLPVPWRLDRSDDVEVISAKERADPTEPESRCAASRPIASSRGMSTASASHRRPWPRRSWPAGARCTS